ncbi:hypothetical protein [Butyrivibrio sp. AC2005]|uniref:hypothetical protein n=1 Tax=Butyrivibrio sp. AC2005 TaxID=1280672 RepID=UPI0004181080|nr:hypothetical protein [Butyrivibrio sp. AC2005]
MVAKDIVEAIDNFLKKEDFRYEYDEERLRFDFVFGLDETVAKSLSCNIVVDKDGDDCSITGYPSIGGIKRNITDVKLLLFEINCHMGRGTWQLDSDNEVRYTLTMPLEGDATITEEMLDCFVYIVPGAVKEYVDSIAAVSMGCSTVEDEVAKLFKNDDEEPEAGTDVDEGVSKTEPKTAEDPIESILFMVQNEHDQKN